MKREIRVLELQVKMEKMGHRDPPGLLDPQGPLDQPSVWWSQGQVE